MALRNPFEFTRDGYEEIVRKTAMPIPSQRSEYDEIELVEDCTLFDLYRQPREPVADPTATRTLLVRVLNAELTCPICLGIIRHTQVVMECLHRFCGDCIQRSLRVGKNECPSCRMHIPSKRSLRRDTNFDALIAKIYPNLDEFSAQEEKLIAALNHERHFHNARTTSTKMGVQNQQTLRRNGGKKKLTTDADGETSSPSDAASSASASNGHSGDKRTHEAASSSNGTAASTTDTAARKKPRTVTSTSSTSATTSPPSAAATSASSADASPPLELDEDKVNFRLVLHPEEDSDGVPHLARTLFRTSYKLKVRHLKKHLIALLKLESFKNMRIVLPAKNCTLSGLSSCTMSPDAKGMKQGDSKVVIRKDLTFDQELEDYVTLYDIYQQYGMGTKWELQLYFHFSDSILNGVAQFIASGV